VKKKLVIIGGMGSGEIAISVFEDANQVLDEWDIEGYLNDIKEPGQYLGRHKVIGTTDEILDYVNKGYYIHNALLFNAKDKKNRVDNFITMNIPIEVNATAIHPTAHIMQGTKIGNGVIICPYAVTSFGPEIENFIHVYTQALIGHDSKIKNFSTIAAHSVIGARVVIEEGAHIGLNSTIREDIRIGKYSILGMGSVVVKDVDDFAVVAGNPAKFLKSLK